MKPASWHAFSARVRLVTWATGSRAAAPAQVRQAVAVIPAARRSGRKTPCAPNAAAERITAPRLRGSVTPSSATSSGAGCSSAAASRSSNGSYANGGTCRPTPWCSTPPVIRSSSARLTSRIGDAPVGGGPDDLGDPLVDVDAHARRRARSPARAARSASSTGLRPTSSSGASLGGLRLAARRDPGPDRAGAAAAPGRGGGAAGRRHAAAAAAGPRWCPWCPAGRSWARGPRRPPPGAPCPASRRSLGQLLVAGVALVPRPLVGGQGAAAALRGWPGSCRRSRRGALLRRDVAGHAAASCPASVSCPPIVHRGPCGVSSTTTPAVLELVAHRVGGGPVLAGPGRGPLLQGQRHQRVDHAAQLVRRPPPVHCGSSGSSPRTSSIARTAGQRSSPTAASSPSASAALPSRTGRARPRARADVFRSSSIASTNAAGSSPGSPGADPLGGPLHEALDPPVRRRPPRAAPPRSSRSPSGSAAAAQVVAQLDRPDPERLDRRQVDHVAERLAHLGAAEVEQRRGAPRTGRTAARPRCDWAISFSWCGKIRSSPPPWMSNSAPR